MTFSLVLSAGRMIYWLFIYFRWWWSEPPLSVSDNSLLYWSTRIPVVVLSTYRHSMELKTKPIWIPMCQAYTAHYRAPAERTMDPSNVFVTSSMKTNLNQTPYDRFQAPLWHKWILMQIDPKDDSHVTSSWTWTYFYMDRIWFHSESKWTPAMELRID